jgi:ATP synthase F1 gamma subunit
MSKATDMHRQYTDLATIEEIAKVFETIASVQIRQIRDRVVASREFFHELWSLYIQLRIDSNSPVATLLPTRTIDRTAVILISSEDTLSGSIDEELVDEVLGSVNEQTTDFFVIGKKGAKLLRNQGIIPTKVFPLPDISKPVNVVPIIALTQDYKTTVVYFEQFVNLTTQQVQVFELVAGISRLSEAEAKVGDTTLIFSSDYIFEPSLEEVVMYLESMMRATALTELILESRLAQLASRFRAMSSASTAAGEQKVDVLSQYRRLQRQMRDSSARIFVRDMKGLL